MGIVFVAAVGFFISFEVAPGAVESDAFDLPSTFVSPVAFTSGLPWAWAAPGVAASLVAGAFIGAAVSALGEAAAGDSF